MFLNPYKCTIYYLLSIEIKTNTNPLKNHAFQENFPKFMKFGFKPNFPNSTTKIHVQEKKKRKKMKRKHLLDDAKSVDVCAYFLIFLFSSLFILHTLLFSKCPSDRPPIGPKVFFLLNYL